MDSPQPVLEYSPPTVRYRGGGTSIWIGVAIAMWCAFVLGWGDPFHSDWNEKAIRFFNADGVVGMLVAVRDLSRAKAMGVRAARQPTIGLTLSALATLASWILLPYI